MAQQKVDWISGPIYLGHFRNDTLSKEVYVFGDVHTPDVKCDKSNALPIDQFIERTLTDTKEKVHVFFEFDMRNKVTVSDQLPDEKGGFLYGQTMERFMKYTTGQDAVFGGNKHRIVAADIRSVLHPRNNYNDNPTKAALNSLDEIYLEAQYDDEFMRNPNLARQQIYRGIGLVETLQFKELQVLAPAITGDQNAVRVLETRFDQLKERLTDMNVCSLDQWDDFMSVFKLFEEFPSMIMDMNLFGKFVSDTVKRAIIYAGNYHAKTFLTLLFQAQEGWKLVEPKVESHWTEKCLDVSKFKQPFFSDTDNKGFKTREMDKKHGINVWPTQSSMNPSRDQPMDTTEDTFQMKARSRPIINPDNQNDVKVLKSTQDDIKSVANGDASRRARSVTGLDNPDLQLPFWPLYHIDNQKATEYRPGDRLAVRIILPPGCVEINSKEKKGRSKAPVNNNDKIDELTTQLRTIADRMNQLNLTTPVNLGILKNEVDTLQTQIMEERKQLENLKKVGQVVIEAKKGQEEKREVATTIGERAKALGESIQSKYQEWQSKNQTGQQTSEETKAALAKLISRATEITKQLEKLGTKVDKPSGTQCPFELGMEGDDNKKAVCSFGGFFNHDCIEVFLIGEIQFVHPKDPLLNGEGVLYKLIPKQVVVDPSEYQKYVVENFVPESKYLGVPIVYWLGVYDDLMSATIFVTSAYKSLQQIVDDIGQENLDPTTRMAEYDVLAIRRSRMQGRFGLRESQVKINPAEFLGKENPLPSSYGKAIVERKVVPTTRPQVRMFAFELPRKRKRSTTKSKRKRFR